MEEIQQTRIRCARKDSSVYPARLKELRYGKFLSEHGVQVISGMAAGIDAEGHKGALEGGTPTFAVLGNGVDICYPSSSRGIYRRIPEKN